MGVAKGGLKLFTLVSKISSFRIYRFQDKATIDNMDRKNNMLACSHFSGNPIFLFFHPFGDLKPNSRPMVLVKTS